MNAIINDRDILNRLRPLDVGQYLASKGWAQIYTEQGRAAIWSIKKESADEYEVLLPLQGEISGYAVRMAEMIQTLSEVEKRTQLEIYEDLSSVSLDITRARLETEGGHSGMIPINDGPQVFQSARDIIIAAACAAIQPRPLFPRRKPERAMEYLRHAMIGTKPGSFVLTFASRIQPTLQQTLPPLETDPPFERKVMLTLASGLSHAHRAAESAALGGGIEPFKEAIQHGASANLCEAIVGLYEGCGQTSVEFSFSFSPLRGLPSAVSIPKSIKFTADRIGYIKEAAKVFRETTPIENTEVTGYVTRLDRESDRAGKVTIAGLADGRPGKFAVELDEPAHTVAISAYEKGAPVSCSGTLQREGNSWVLKEPRAFSLLPEE